MLERYSRVLVPAILSSAMVLSAAAGRAAAQSSSEAAPAARGVEFGASSGMLVIYPTFGVRLTGVLSPRFALEGVAEVVPWTLDETGGKFQLFQGQLRHTFSRGSRWTWHATYGSTFFTEYNYTPAHTSRMPDGLLQLFPEQRSFRLDAGAIHAGIGGERILASGLAFRWDLQTVQNLDLGAYPAPRGSIGVTWR